MDRSEAIKKLNSHLKTNFITMRNSNMSNITKSGDWWLNPAFDRKNDDWYLILNNGKTRKLHLFHIKANDPIFDKFDVRSDKDVYSLYITVSDTNFREKNTYLNFAKYLVVSLKY